MKYTRLALLISFLSLQACVTTPVPMDEYLYAKTAMDYARSVDAAKYSPGYWHQAEESYRKAQLLYKEHYNSEAKQEFLNAKSSAEKAENSARVQRFKNGDVL